ncbi:hypothetical protein SPRG_07939 [Saprolegnia parasitica CBS 223.65]|uniref:Uncharacterized protein n=1 Tax=Saprolegnia parasitica (strain CBS 223.65) TaxID=695850 RepID=A0A067CI93_SAPPC|nr:hypothetical protein SPRG_07939 [Saprolegnia parasitica CBS 223.65]KDO26537.1 hypothetical protein SPRG_07939 [Saprolegnia parasitica CBS 223.65]|eukprot:XP_012202680.1 hypothetical protein SPRG_07939 [Saprolegnia parasitica CBS 223.65]
MVNIQYLALAAATTSSVASRGIKQRPITFAPPFKSIDPSHFSSILGSFKNCVSTCTKTTSYADASKDAWTAFGTLGRYTACATSCVATEVLNTVGYYKSTYGLIYDVYANHLEQTKKYLAGASDFDMIGNRTRVDYSCCLPNEYFVPWEQVTVEVFAFYEPADKSFSATTKLNGNGIPVNVRADKYLDYCAQDKGTNPKLTAFEANYLDGADGTGGLKLYCDAGLFYYLSTLKGNLGQQIIHPDYAKQVPNGACTKRTNCDVTLKPNPVGVCYDGSVCVVEKTRIVDEAGASVDSDDEYDYLTDIVVTKPSEKGTCDKVKLLWNNKKNRYLELTMLKVSGASLNLFKVSGLPRFEPATRQCAFSGELGTRDIKTVNKLAVNWVWDPIDWFCSEWYQWIDFKAGDGKRYHHGNVEYCNARQYANHLTRELFDYTQCPFYNFQLDQDKSIADLYQNEDSDGTKLTTLYGFFDFNPGYSIACLYRIVSLKCDCMRAVVNCYENENAYTSVLGKTLGRASSILCGFILCQQPSIYRMFADADGLRHTVIMQEILLQTNLLDATSTSSIAAMVLVSFGLGMVAFVAVKHALASTHAKSTMEDGYRNLI